MSKAKTIGKSMEKKLFRKSLFLCLAAVLLSVTGCSRYQASRPANVMIFSLENISEVIISYDEEQVTFLPGNSGELVVKEYMTEDKNSYHARVTQKKDSIKISEGGKPLFKSNFVRRIEVFLPADYHENLTVTTTDGDINFSETELFLDNLFIDSTSGTVCLDHAQADSIRLSSSSGAFSLGNLSADSIKITTTSGNVVCKSLIGNVTCKTTRGNVEIKAASGAGSYSADNSGDLRITYNEVSGDLSFYNKNGTIFVTLPAQLEFEFEAVTKNGSIITSFQESITMDSKSARGIIGSRPTAAVRAETRNGNIEVRQ